MWFEWCKSLINMPSVLCEFWRRLPTFHQSGESPNASKFLVKFVISSPSQLLQPPIWHLARSLLGEHTCGVNCSSISPIDTLTRLSTVASHPTHGALTFVRVKSARCCNVKGQQSVETSRKRWVRDDSQITFMDPVDCQIPCFPGVLFHLLACCCYISQGSLPGSAGTAVVQRLKGS